MTTYREVAELFSRWIDRVAAAIVEARAAFRPRRLVRLVEQEDGVFALQDPLPGTDALPSVRIAGGTLDAAEPDKLQEVLRGARVELVLQPRRFVFRLLELPRRASDFLDGIVRSQIDRLTPWSAADAAFGWHPSEEAGSDRMVVTVAATARTLIDPFVAAIAGLGADTVIVSAALQSPQPDARPIRIFEQNAGRAGGLRRVRRILLGLLAGAGILAAASVAASAIVGAAIETQRDDLSRAAAERRAAMKQGHGTPSEAELDLQRRKRQTPSAVIVVEALSRILPDDTYLSELRILGGKLQIVGLTRDAPSLIRLIEQTPHFRKATFFAPTTRSPADSGEHFSIEARIEPVFVPSP